MPVLHPQMRALRTAFFSSWRSWVAIILDRCGELCAYAAERCFLLAGRFSPAPALSPEAADRIWAGVKARIDVEPSGGRTYVWPPAVPMFQPTPVDLSAAALADQQQKAVYRVYTPDGAVLYVSRQQGRS